MGSACDAKARTPNARQERREANNIDSSDVSPDAHATTLNSRNLLLFITGHLLYVPDGPSPKRAVGRSKLASAAVAAAAAATTVET